MIRFDIYGFDRVLHTDFVDTVIIDDHIINRDRVAVFGISPKARQVLDMTDVEY